MKLATKSLLKIALLLATLQSTYVVWAQGSVDCKDEGHLGYICSLNNPEDLIQVEGSSWVITSNMGDKTWSGGGFYLVSTRDKSVRPLKPDLSGAKAAIYKDCPGPPEANKLQSHGLSVRNEGNGKHVVYSVNHGGRRSVEIYDLDVTGEPKLTWKGCAVAPAPLFFNSVAHLPNEGFVATVLANAEDPKAVERAIEGLPSGFVLEWSPAAGWTTVPGSELPGNNGIVASRDGKTLYVAGYTSQTVNKISRGRVPYSKQAVRIGFLVDNLRWTPDGKILAVGHVTQFSKIQECIRSDAVCPVTTGVAVVDPETMKAETLVVQPNTKNFGGGTSAIVVGEELWIGAFRAQRIGTIKLKDLPRF
ncbi:hypothetical protein EZ313_16665 [Ramlibacter henchirensis]|uniref:SMP-30/Gluconolactonase/LRE-like region domain-containing protein n=1 Tax=Ramlibacter henchirensis TaxID=204072 RepID=A0A4Z0BX72_9BURK|nr:hypothetical protein [Ramlibacter henchirensis]TFZ02868.1 hypothetical protein EZ313_16665 [Ramlibacter henchirensis]